MLKGCYVTRQALCALLVLLPILARGAADDERILAARNAATAADIPRLSALARESSDHVLEPYVRYWLLSARIARITEPNPVEPVQAFLRENEGSVLAERLRSDWLKRLAREGEWSLFDAHYIRMAQPDQDLQCSAMQRNGQTRELETQWLNLVDTPSSCEQPLRELVLTGRVSTEEVWWRFRRLVEARRLSAAKATAGWLGDRVASDVELLDSVFSNPSRFLSSPQARATGSRARRELILAAVTRLSRSNLDEAARRWQSLPDKDFEADERAYAWGQLAWMAAQSQRDEARMWFSRAGEVPMSEEQRAWRARAALRERDWRDVRSAIEHMSEKQRELPEWTYWLARAQVELGNGKEATPLLLRIAHGADFYGILAAEALGRRFEWPQSAAPVTPIELEAAQQVPEFRRAFALLRLDMRLEGLREWNWGLRTAADRQLLAAAELARREGFYDRAIAAAERTKNEHDFGLRYLAPYFETFSTQARANQIDLAWVYGLVRQESRFYAIAQSSAGARGLMQVMPATGRWIAARIGANGYHAGWLDDIEGNVRLGTAYLRNVLDDTGHPVMASAAYNAGPGRAKRWRDNRSLEGAIYAETIPFNETRDYVKRVMANATIYAALLGNGERSLMRRLGTIGGD